jgi:hypothetical protein
MGNVCDLARIEIYELRRDPHAAEAGSHAHVFAGRFASFVCPAVIGFHRSSRYV